MINMFPDSMARQWCDDGVLIRVGWFIKQNGNLSTQGNLERKLAHQRQIRDSDVNAHYPIKVTHATVSAYVNTCHTSLSNTPSAMLQWLNGINYTTSSLSEYEISHIQVLQLLQKSALKCTFLEGTLWKSSRESYEKCLWQYKNGNKDMHK